MAGGLWGGGLWRGLWGGVRLAGECGWQGGAVNGRSARGTGGGVWGRAAHEAAPCSSKLDSGHSFVDTANFRATMKRKIFNKWGELGVPLPRTITWELNQQK